MLILNKGILTRAGKIIFKYKTNGDYKIKKKIMLRRAFVAIQTEYLLSMSLSRKNSICLNTKSTKPARYCVFLCNDILSENP